MENKFVSLKFLINKLDKYKPSPRTLQSILKELIECNRVIVQGGASTTEYAINDIISNYRRFEFIYVVKDNEIAGILFKLSDRYRFYYDNEFLINKSKPIPSLDLQILPFDFNNILQCLKKIYQKGINREILETTSRTADEFQILTMLEDNIGDLSFTKTREIVKNKSSNPSYLSSLNEILGSNPKINVLKDLVVDIEDEILFPDGYDISKLEIKKSSRYIWISV